MHAPLISVLPEAVCTLGTAAISGPTSALSAACCAEMLSSCLLAARHRREDESVLMVQAWGGGRGNRKGLAEN